MARLHFNNVSIHYPIYDKNGTSLRKELVRIGTGGIIGREPGGIRVVTALDGVSFEINKGDAVGLIGHNGAGKSTLLRTMAGIYTPYEGTITRSGRVATLFELGAGMHPDHTGMENIWRTGLLMGLDPAQIRQALPDIEDFTELGEFLDLPLRTYSAGMTTRLMFAIATSTHPEIFLVDEIFGTGDAAFQEKAVTRLQALIEKADIFVLASHDVSLIRQHCNRYFHLEHGKLRELEQSELPD